MVDSVVQLAEVLPTVRSRIEKYRGNRRFNEQNTKASLILPVLEALGWNTNDPEDVQWEYKPKPRHNPVDFALVLKRTPCLFLEAKALRESLHDDKLVTQILTYASVAGVQWVVLSNGDEYRIYNANAPVPAEEKLFKAISLTRDDTAYVLSTLSLLSKVDLQERKISRLWESHFVDCQVKSGLERLLDPEEPSMSVLRAIKKFSHGRLRTSDIRASLRRAQLQIDFPEEPEVDSADVSTPKKRSEKQSRRTERSEATREKSKVSLEALIAEGLLKPPVDIVARYRKQSLRARINEDASVLFNGKRFTSLSMAGGAARKPLHKGKLKKGALPSTNGWTFWKCSDPEDGSLVELDSLRSRFVHRKTREARRFARKA